MSTPDKKMKITGFTLLELIIGLLIILILAGAIRPLWGPFMHRRDIEMSVFKTYQDLRQAWQFSRSLRDGHKYYGVRFFNNLGQNGDRNGYKIGFFYKIAGTYDQDPDLPIGPTTPFKVVKSSQSSDSPELLEDTFFPPGVIIPCESEIDIDQEAIIFTPQGSATSNGVALLTSTQDEIIISKGKYSQKIIILPLTGHAQIQRIVP